MSSITNKQRIRASPLWPVICFVVDLIDSEGKNTLVTSLTKLCPSSGLLAIVLKLDPVSTVNIKYHAKQ